jgi:hypothetical protein
MPESPVQVMRKRQDMLDEGLVRVSAVRSAWRLTPGVVCVRRSSRWNRALLPLGRSALTWRQADMAAEPAVMPAQIASRQNFSVRPTSTTT